MGWMEHGHRNIMAVSDAIDGSADKRNEGSPNEARAATSLSVFHLFIDSGGAPAVSSCLPCLSAKPFLPGDNGEGDSRVNAWTVTTQFTTSHTHHPHAHGPLTPAHIDRCFTPFSKHLHPDISHLRGIHTCTRDGPTMTERQHRCSSESRRFGEEIVRAP